MVNALHTPMCRLASSRPVEVGEFGAELICVGVASAKSRAEAKTEVVEDVQGLLPSLAGRIAIASGVVGVAQVGESGGLAMAVAELPLQGEGLLVVGGGLLVTAEVVVGVAGAVQRLSLRPAAAEVLQEGEGLLGSPSSA